MPFTYKKDMSIGNLEAETDFFLDKCFIKTDAYNALLDFDNEKFSFFKRILVGRTGSGKTALLKHLNTENSLSKNEIIEAEKTIFEYIKNNRFISNLIDDNIDLRIFFKALWVHVILIKIIDIEIGKPSFIENLFHKKRELYDYINSYNDTFFDEDALVEITERFEDAVSAEISSSHANFKGKSIAETEQKKQAITNNYVSKELLSMQKKIISYIKTEYNASNKQKKIIINIDDLDKSWLLTRSVKYEFINALLDAFKEFLDIPTVKILVSIRTDILDGVYKNNYRQNEKDQSFIIPIEWTKKEIIELIDKRLQYLMEDKYQKRKLPSFSSLFNFKINGIMAYEYILNRTMLRPRDTIDFINRCLKEADGETKIKEAHVLKAEETYFTSRKQALIDEWRSIYPAIESYIDLIQVIETQEFTIEMIQEKIRYIKEHLMEVCNDKDDLIKKLYEYEEYSDESTIKDVLDIWFSIGIIGIKKANDVIIYSEYEKEHLDISDYKKTFKIHDLYWKQ